MINGIHHVAIHTPNWDRMLRFYTEGLGFVPAFAEQSWRDSPAIDRAIGVAGSAARTIMLKAGNCFLEMFEYASPPARNADPLRPHDHGYTHFALDVSDIAAEMARLAGHGMTFADDQPLSSDEIRAIYGRDPDGNIIELQEIIGGQGLALGDLAPLRGSDRR